MKKMIMSAALLAASTTFALAQTETPAQTPAPATTPAPADTMTPADSTTTAPATGMDTTTGANTTTGTTMDTDADSSTPAVATPETTNSAAPVAGANSFTEDQARSRITDAGYTDVGPLTKDDSGIWRTTAKKDGASHSVALDYQGNIVNQ